MILPSIITHIFSGLTLFISLVYAVYFFPKIQLLDTYKTLLLLLLFSIAAGIHAVSHIILEKTYNYNPYQYLELIKQ